jgi:hypothetical protein
MEEFGPLVPGDEFVSKTGARKMELGRIEVFERKPGLPIGAIWNRLKRDEHDEIYSTPSFNTLQQLYTDLSQRNVRKPNLR